MINKVFVMAFIVMMAMVVSCGNKKYDESEFWNGVLTKYSKDTAVTSIVLVKYTEGSNAEVSYYLRKDGDWQLDDTCRAFVGKNGLGKEKEGDAKTPEGEFNASSAFGILPNPGTEVPYIEVQTSTFACDEEGEYYNQIIDTVGTGHQCKGEDMHNLAPDYNYGFALDYNKENVYPKGSNIFFHCTGSSTSTHGCVAVDESFIKHILETCGKAPKFCIYKK